MSIFPSIDIDTEETTTENEYNNTFLEFDYEEGEFVLETGEPIMVYNTDAIKQWIIKVLRTEKFRFSIYNDTDYGVTIEDLIVGTTLPIGIVQSELKREITDALTQHKNIESLSNFSFSRSKSLLTIGFTVNLDDETSTEIEVVY